MYNATSPMAKSTAGLAVLGLLTIAIVAGQAEANLPAAAKADADISRNTAPHIVFSASELQEYQRLPAVLDTFLALPKRVELTIDLLGERPETAEIVVSPLHD
jgi:hypothetical protein